MDAAWNQSRSGHFWEKKVREFCIESNHEFSAVQPSDSNKGTIPVPGMSVDE